MARDRRTVFRKSSLPLRSSLRLRANRAASLRVKRLDHILDVGEVAAGCVHEVEVLDERLAKGASHRLAVRDRRPGADESRPGSPGATGRFERPPPRGPVGCRGHRLRLARPAPPPAVSPAGLRDRGGAGSDTGSRCHRPAAPVRFPPTPRPPGEPPPREPRVAAHDRPEQSLDQFVDLRLRPGSPVGLAPVPRRSLEKALIRGRWLR